MITTIYISALEAVSVSCLTTPDSLNRLPSAVPMAARVSQKVGAEEDPTNFLLMHAMGPNVAGVIGTAVAAGSCIRQLSYNTGFPEQITEHQHTNKGRCCRKNQRNDDCNNDREQNLLQLGDRPKLRHFDLSFLLCCQKFHNGRLNVPIAFGMLLVNIYPDIMAEYGEGGMGGGLLYYFYKLDEWAILPSLKSNSQK